MNAQDRDQRIREKAHQMWLEEGQPEGRADAHWDMATELVAIEENQLLTLKPVKNPFALSPNGEPVEPLLAVENAGEFPTLTDQGEEKAYPSAPPPQRSVASAKPGPARRSKPR